MARRRRDGDRAGVVDVVENADTNAPTLSADERMGDGLCLRAVEPEVVQRDLERALRRGQELRHLARDLEGGLSAIAQRADL